MRSLSTDKSQEKAFLAMGAIFDIQEEIAEELCDRRSDDECRQAVG